MMKKEMRRHEKQLETAEALQILEVGEYGILSMVTKDNEPYTIPLNYILWNNNLYFHCALEGYKLDIIRNNDKVSFCVVGSTEVLPQKITTKYESAIAYGSAQEIDGDEKYQALVKFLEKYSSEFMEEGIKYLDKALKKTAVIKLTTTEISGKRGKG